VADNRPLIPELVVKVVEARLLFEVPLLVAYLRVELVVVPALEQKTPLSALLASAPRKTIHFELMGNHAPLVML
jgi:hypothetical protein